MGANSVKGLKMMETVYPSDDGRSVFSDPKLKAKLDKEIAKGKIQPELPSEEEPVDGDSDALVERVIKDVWATYDVKNLGFIDKKQAAKFFSDALEVYALRRAQKLKDVMGPGVNQKKATDDCVAKLNKSGNGRITFEEFEDFISSMDIDEALGPFFNKNGIDITTKVQFLDVNTLAQAKAEGPKPRYREYPDD